MPERPELSVFLSYSRADLAFAEQLSYSLGAFGVSVAVDHAEIQGGESWKNRLRQMILEADCVAFVLSPSSAASEVCGWEVETALGLSKRILPVLVEPLGTVEPHPRLRELNYIFFYPEPSVPDSGFGKGLATLIAALSQDIDWIRDHTRLVGMAARWDDSGRSTDLLLRGSELQAFLDWRARRPSGAPALIPVQQALLKASEQAERDEADARRRRLEEMAAAQQEREAALKVAERSQQDRERAVAALVRRTFAGISVALVLSVIAVGFAVRSIQEAERANQEATRANQEATRANEALKRALAERELQGRMLDLAQNRAPPQPPFKVEDLARRYEGQTSDHVSTDFDVGHFYGIFRIRSGPNILEFMAFLQRHFEPFAAVLKAAGGVEAANRADPAFVAAWKKLATEEATASEFELAQVDFVFEKDFKRLKERLTKPLDPSSAPGDTGIGIDVSERSTALQSVVFSIAVQYGPATPVPVVALTGADPAALDDRELIERFFAERDRAEKYFSPLIATSKEYGDLIRLRNKWEKDDALYILDRE